MLPYSVADITWSPAIFLGLGLVFSSTATELGALVADVILLADHLRSEGLSKALGGLSAASMRNT